MTQAEQEIVQCLHEAHASELGLVSDLQAQIARSACRVPVLARAEGRVTNSSLGGEEPWPAYDELSGAEIRAVLAEGNQTSTSEVRAYGRSHKNRAGIMRAAEPEHSRS